MREGLNKPIFSRICLQSFFIFLSRALADVFEKNEKKDKATSGYRLLVSYLNLLVSNFKGRVKFKTRHSLNSYVRCVLCKTRVDVFS